MSENFVQMFLVADSSLSLFVWFSFFTFSTIFRFRGSSGSCFVDGVECILLDTFCSKFLATVNWAVWNGRLICNVSVCVCLDSNIMQNEQRNERGIIPYACDGIFYTNMSIFILEIGLKPTQGFTWWTGFHL